MRSLFFLLLCTLAAHSQTTTADGFALPQLGQKFSFPRDHGSHPNFRTEWWYVTGHLDGEQGQRFGFQLTFFRQAQKIGSTVQQLHLAHAALSSTSTQQFLHEEKLQRAGWAAAASETGLDVRQDQWQLAQVDEKHLRLAFTVRGEAAVELELSIDQPLVVFGKDSVSKKGASPQAASHYLTFPKLGARGSVKLGAKAQPVTGTAWMDHEFSSSQLEPGQVGWDWAAIQLNDGREIMAYRMRRADGSTDPFSTLALIGADGQLQHFPADQFQWQALSSWQSPRNQATYPQHVKLQFGTETLELRPILADQEQGGSITGLPYWEGACDVLDAGSKPVGRAFLELAGYAGDLGRHLRAE
jgi:predicted secreted hydrolase